MRRVPGRRVGRGKIIIAIIGIAVYGLFKVDIRPFLEGFVDQPELSDYLID